MVKVIITVAVDQKDSDRVVSKLRTLGFDPTVEKQDDTDVCPVCGAELELDYEYMAKTYGEGYTYVPRSKWVFFCTECEEAGTIDELESFKVVKHG